MRLSSTWPPADFYRHDHQYGNEPVRSSVDRLPTCLAAG
jgi:hypothetical protein